MSLIQAFGLDDMASASAFVAFGDQEQAEAVHYLSLIPQAIQELKKNPRSHQLLAIRCDTLLCLAKAYATQNRASFTTLAQGLLAHPLSLARKFQPNRSLLLYDLALAIGTKRNAVAKNLAAAIFAIPETPGRALADDIYADILARLFDLQFDAAAEANQRLHQMAKAKQLTRREAEYALNWFNMASSLLARDGNSLVRAAQEITANQRSHVNPLLGRWAGGQHTELIEFDFWDMKTTALLSIADSFGLWPADIEPASIAFANWRWTEGRDEWV